MSEVGYIFPKDAADQIVTVGNEIKNTDDKLLDFATHTKELIEILKKENISFEKLQKIQKETVETTTKLDAIGKTLLQSEEKLKQVTDKRTESIIRNRAETRNATRDIQLKVRAQQAEKGSIEQLSAVNAILEKRLKSVNLATAEGAKKAEILRNAINRNTTKIMANSSEFSKWKINIGNYRSALESLPGPIGNVVSQTGNIVTAVAKLGPVGGIVAGTIVAAGAQLLAFFTATERGAEMMERKWAGMKAAWKTLVGEIAKGGEDIASKFEEPEKGNFWTKFMTVAGGGIMSKRFREIGQRMDSASFAAEQYTKVLQDVEDEEKRLLVPRALANDALSKANQIYNDADSSLKERKQALQEIIKIEDAAAAEEIRLQQVKVAGFAEIKAARDEDGTDSTEARNNLYAAQAELVALGTESTNRKKRANKQIIALDKEEIAAEKEKAKVIEEAAKERAKYYEELQAQITKAEGAINDEFNKEINGNQDKYDKMIQARKDYDNEMRLLSKQLFEDADKLEEEKNNASMEAADKKGKENKKQAEEESDKRKQIADEVITKASELGNVLFDLKLANLNREFQAAEGNEKKQAEISAKIAKAEKNKALFDIAINTAVGITKAIPNIALMAFAAAMGGLQAAVVASKPIPKFATGTDYAPSEFIAGEKGRELVKTKSGEIVLADNATHFKGNRFKGATVYTNRETEQIIKDAGKGNNFVFDTTELRDGLKAVEKAINKKPVAITDNSGRIVGRQSNNYRETYLNRLQNGR